MCNLAFLLDNIANLKQLSKIILQRKHKKNTSLFLLKNGISRLLHNFLFTLSHKNNIIKKMNNEVTEMKSRNEQISFSLNEENFPMSTDDLVYFSNGYLTPGAELHTSRYFQIFYVDRDSSGSKNWERSFH